MTREELRAAGLNDEQITAVMALHGRDTTAANAARETLQQQVNAAQKELEAAKNRMEQQAAGYAYDRDLRAAIREAGAVNEDDVAALLPGQDGLRSSQNRAADIRAALDAFKTEKPYLFTVPQNTAPAPTAEPEPEPAPIVMPKPNSAGAAGDPTVEDFTALSGMQRMELRAKNPALFQQLVNELAKRRTRF